MKCPDCKIKLTKEDIIESRYVDLKGDGVGYDVPIFECPKCNVEWAMEDLDE